MKKWRFFPILVKIEVLKNMNLMDKFSFSKCSKNCRNLVTRVPSYIAIHQIPKHNRFSVLLTCRKSSVRKVEVKIENCSDLELVDQFFGALLRDSLKVRELTMNINPEYSGMYKKFIDFCDPFYIESIKIGSLDSQEIYEDILRSPQWKRSREVSLNWDFDRFLEVNLNDFLHFKSIKLKMEELSVEDAWKLVEKFLINESPDDSSAISTQIPINIDSIREKIESELAGDWKGMAYGNDARFLVHPKNPQLIFEYSWEGNEFSVAFITPETFHVYRPLLLD
ncbi:unnamed protein product [Caenorhabditis brenneri]